jgi:hypothetical protein
MKAEHLKLATDYATMGALGGAALGAGAGALLDPKKRWRGALIGAGLGGLTGGTAGYIGNLKGNITDARSLSNRFYGQALEGESQLSAANRSLGKIESARLLSEERRRALREVLGLVPEPARITNDYRRGSQEMDELYKAHGASGLTVEMKDHARELMRPFWNHRIFPPDLLRRMEEGAQQPPGHQTKDSHLKSAIDSAVLGGLGGAALGAGAGALLDRNKRLRGALIGAGLGGLVGGTTGYIGDLKSDLSNTREMSGKFYQRIGKAENATAFARNKAGEQKNVLYDLEESREKLRETLSQVLEPAKIISEYNKTYQDPDQAFKDKGFISPGQIEYIQDLLKQR